MNKRTVNHINFKLSLPYLFILLMFSGVNSENANDPENSQRRRSGGGCIELILGTGGVGAAKSCTEHGSSKFDIEQEMRREKLEKELSPYSEEIKKSEEEWRKIMEGIEKKRLDYIVEQDEMKRIVLKMERARNIAAEIFLNEITKKEVGDINFLIFEKPLLKKYFYSNLMPDDFSKSEEKSNICVHIINRLSDIGIDFINEESQSKRVNMINEFIKIKKYEEEYMKIIAHDTVSDLIYHLKNKKKLTSKVINKEIQEVNQKNRGYSMLSLSSDGFYFHVNIRVARKSCILNMHTDLLGIAANGIASAITYQVAKTIFSPPPNRYWKISCLSCHPYNGNIPYFSSKDLLINKDTEDEKDQARKNVLDIAYNLIYKIRNKKIKKSVINKAVGDINREYKKSVLNQTKKEKLTLFDIHVTKKSYALNMRIEFIENNNEKFSSNLKMTEMSFSQENNSLENKSCLSCHFYKYLSFP